MLVGRARWGEMLVVETIARIRREHLGKGVPIKQIARDLRLSRNTVAPPRRPIRVRWAR